MNIRLPLFWSTWSPALGQDSDICAGLAHGCDYSDCRASELKLEKCLAIVFPSIIENTLKQWPTLGDFQPTPTRLPRALTFVKNIFITTCCMHSTEFAQHLLNHLRSVAIQAVAFYLTSIHAASFKPLHPLICFCTSSYWRHYIPMAAAEQTAWAQRSVLRIAAGKFASMQ